MVVLGDYRCGIRCQGLNLVDVIGILIIGIALSRVAFYLYFHCWYRVGIYEEICFDVSFMLTDGYGQLAGFAEVCAAADYRLQTLGEGRLGVRGLVLHGESNPREAKYQIGLTAVTGSAAEFVNIS